MKLAVLQAWHDAVAAGDADRVVALSSADVVLEGPRGAARGAEVLRAWVGDAGAVLEPVRWFCGAGDAAVVLQRATWPGGRDGPVEVATAFAVRDGAVARIARHPTLAAALADAGLNPADEARRGG